MGEIALKAYSKQKGMAANESGKVQRIMSLAGLNVRDGKNTLTTQLVKKKKCDWGWEYKYKIPLGRCFEDYLAKINVLQDGLNNRRKRVTFDELKALEWQGSILSNLKELWKTKLTELKVRNVKTCGNS